MRAKILQRRPCHFMFWKGRRSFPQPTRCTTVFCEPGSKSAWLYFFERRIFSRSRETIDRSIKIGGVKVDDGPIGSGRPDLVPSISNLSREIGCLPADWIGHLRWMLQKDLCLAQDFLLLGPPSLARDRRHMLFLYAALVGREVEYVPLTKNTSDADLKQRKEMIQNDSVYFPQAPVRAAVNGRLLILDGVEKAERNVLPTLNNLLENRELSLDDGGLLVPPRVYDEHVQGTYHADRSFSTNLLRVHPDFRVAALASTPSSGDIGTTANMLDPPLRSRFQSRAVYSSDPGDILESVVASGSVSTITIDQIKELVTMATRVREGMSLQCLRDAAKYLDQYPNHVTAETALLPYGLEMICKERIREDFPGLPMSTKPMPSNFVETSTINTVQSMILAAFKSGQRAVAIVGPKGSFKSVLAKHLAARCNVPCELFSLYSDMTARDLLMTRGTDDAGNTVWKTTPLTRAVQNGWWVIMDGIDKIDEDSLSSIANILERGHVDLPNGERVYAAGGFHCISLAHPPTTKDWPSPEVVSMFHWVKVAPLPPTEQREVLMSLYPSLGSDILNKIMNLQAQLNQAISTGAADNLERREVFELSFRKIRHICKRVERNGAAGLAKLVESVLLTRMLPDRERKIIQTCMKDVGITHEPKKQDGMPGLHQGLLKLCQRVPKNKLLVPNPVFEENPGHTRVLNDILEAHNAGEQALLIMGYQGVGKNKVVDSLLAKMNCEREYVQLHRDTTVHSLLSSPTIENGKVIYNDSPLVRAAKYGRILIIDEADKAPTEVVALLKGLIEDGELALPDGRVLRSDFNMQWSDINSTSTIPIHSDFCLWALANPPGYPFHGNDLAHEMADVFSCHVVPALDPESQKNILKIYGPDLDDKLIDKVILIWKELREEHERGVLVYPFSIREAVSVVKHLNAFPEDSFEEALNNVISFDIFDTALMKQLGSIFMKHGIRVGNSYGASDKTVHDGLVGGISTPKTRASSPKHGKIDENNDPHVGGNTWAGGSGGSDTAGLGGRGGPYRLDSGHAVHQVSDEMKAQVSAEAKARARTMATEALDKKLTELKMGKVEWKRFDDLYQQVALQIQQLQVMLKSISRHKHERVWLHRQTSGELDDTRLVDAVTGEKNVFKKRGIGSKNIPYGKQSSDPISIKLVADVSASMYRFNGYDGRLQRLLEATLMIMESLKDNQKFKLEIVGHNGDNAYIPFFDPEQSSLDPGVELQILEGMVAHTQYTFPGDRTLEAIDNAIQSAREGDVIIVVSDANLRRYRISPTDISTLFRHHQGIHTHLILIGGFDEEVDRLVRAIPNERAQVCLDSADLPLIIKKIVANAASGLK